MNFDLTDDQKLLAEQLRLLLAARSDPDRLRTLIDALPDYIFAKDTQGRFTLSNKAHARAGSGDDLQAETTG